MRGKVTLSVMWAVPDRITPAYAGKSSHNRSDISIDWDHPRLCGEKFLCDLTPFVVIGSPPPMRGKGECWEIKSVLQGITPAYAGKRQK